MQTKLKFALDEHNNPVIKFQLAPETSDDLRDDVAKRFFEALGYTSKWLQISFDDNKPLSGIISPITPIELEVVAKEIANPELLLEAKSKIYKPS